MHQDAAADVAESQVPAQERPNQRKIEHLAEAVEETAQQIAAESAVAGGNHAERFAETAADLRPRIAAMCAQVFFHPNLAKAEETGETQQPRQHHEHLGHVVRGPLQGPASPTSLVLRCRRRGAARPAQCSIRPT